MGNDPWVSPLPQSIQSAHHYQFSSSDDYFLMHWEHQFQKWGVGNWPLIRLLKSEFLMGFHALTIKHQKTLLP